MKILSRFGLAVVILLSALGVRGASFSPADLSIEESATSVVSTQEQEVDPLRFDSIRAECFGFTAVDSDTQTALVSFNLRDGLHVTFKDWFAIAVTAGNRLRFWTNSALFK